MAVTINTAGTYKVVRVSNADAIAGWAAETLEGSGGGAGLLQSVGTIDLVAEGTDAIATRTNKQRVLLSFTDAAGYDFTTGSTGTGATKLPDGMAYIWAAFLAAGSAFTKAAGGLQIMLGDGTNRSFWNVAGSDTYSGGFQKWAVSTLIAESENNGATATLGDITEIGFVTDVGGNTTRFDNFVVDAMEVGDGLTIQGTTATDKLFSESVTQDEVTAIGVISVENGIIFSQGNLELSGTALTSSAETLVFTDTLGGAYTYQFDVTGTVVMTNSSISGSGLVDFNFDTSAATAFTMNGGAISGFNSLITAAAQVMNGIVFQAGGASTIPNSISNSPFNQCGTITVTGELDTCTIDKSTAAIAVTTTNLNKLVTCTFFKDTATSHAVEITAVAASMIWDGTATGYDAGTAASPVTPTSTGNETLYLNFTSAALFTVNIADGATVPSIRVGAGFTGTVNVVAGQKTFAFTVNPSHTGYEWRIYTVTAVGSLVGSVEIAGEEVATLDNQSISHSYVGQAIAVQVLSANYVESLTYYTVDQSGNISVTLNLITDEND
tara:strand:- start:14115 stop:15770 length:1656 start_codon:yes stop_codon:yes gene_type:complete